MVLPKGAAEVELACTEAWLQYAEELFPHPMTSKAR